MVIVLSELAEFTYKCDDFYRPEDEGGLIWNDDTIDIAWPTVEDVFLSEKDKLNPKFLDLDLHF